MVHQQSVKLCVALIDANSQSTSWRIGRERRLAISFVEFLIHDLAALFCLVESSHPPC